MCDPSLLQRWIYNNNLCPNVTANVCCSIHPEMLLVPSRVMKDEEPRGGSGRERGDSLHYWFLTVREQEITSACRSRFIQVFLMAVHRLSLT